jgi:hypothetical protein
MQAEKVFAAPSYHQGESQFGHRISENLDFFTKDLFDEGALIQSSEFCPILA